MFPLGYQQIFDDVMKKCYCYFCCIDVYVTLLGGWPHFLLYATYITSNNCGFFQNDLLFALATWMIGSEWLNSKYFCRCCSCCKRLEYSSKGWITFSLNEAVSTALHPVLVLLRLYLCCCILFLLKGYQTDRFSLLPNQKMHDKWKTNSSEYSTLCLYTHIKERHFFTLFDRGNVMKTAL